MARFVDTFRKTHVGVHVPRPIVVRRDVKDGCDRYAVMSASSGNVLLSAGEYLSQGSMDGMLERAVKLEF